MAKTYGLYVVLLTALAFWKYCLAEWNTTNGSSVCHLHGKMDNCTETDTEESIGHFSKCPEELKYYCIHGECRYVKDQETPSCKCQSDYVGARCEYVNLEPLIARRKIIIGCTLAVLLFLMILVVSICICSHRRWRLCGQRRRQPEAKNGPEKDSMLNPSTATTAESMELTLTNSV